MNSILRYLTAMLPYCVGAFPIILFWRVRCNRDRHTNWWHEGALIVFALFMAGLASQTVLPHLTGLELGDGTRLETPGGWDGINLTPFHILKETYIEVTRYGNTEYFWINFMGNIVLFIPIGFMIPLLRQTRGITVILAGAGISLTIELLQLFLPRSTDVDDLILNTLGTMLGLWLYRRTLRHFPTLCQKFKR